MQVTTSQKYVVLTLVSIVLHTFCVAQLSYHLKGGGVFNHLSTSLNYAVRNQDKFGLTSGIGIKYNLSPRFSVELESIYIQKNYSNYRTGNFKGIFTKNSNSFLQIPISLDIRFLETKRYSLYFKGGLWGEYWLTSSIKGTIPDIFSFNYVPTTSGNMLQTFILVPYKMKHSFNNAEDNRFMYGGLFGCVVEQKMTKNIHPFAELLSSISFSSLQKSLKKKNNSLILNIGIRLIPIKNKK